MEDRHLFDWITCIKQELICKLSFDDKFFILNFISKEESIYFSGAGIPQVYLQRINDIYQKVRAFIMAKYNYNYNDRQNVFIIFGRITKHLFLINKKYIRYTDPKYIEKKMMAKLDKDYEDKVEAIKEGRYNFETKEIKPAFKSPTINSFYNRSQHRFASSDFS